MRNLIYIIILLFLAIPTHASDFASRLEKASSENKTIAAKFVQVKKIVGIKGEIKSEGDFYYDNTGRMAMIYSRPEGDKVVMKGDEFIITVGGKTIKSDASTNPMMAQVSYMMQASMSGDALKLGQGWDLSIEELPSEYRVVIKPLNRRIKRYISSMTMVFCHETMTLDELRIDEAKGGFTSYTFSSKQINKTIAPSKFE